MKGESVFNGPLLPGYEGPEEDFGALASALRVQVQRRQADAAKLSVEMTGTAFELEVVAQLRIDVADALECLRQSNALTPLLLDGLANFFGACLSTRSGCSHNLLFDNE